MFDIFEDLKRHAPTSKSDDDSSKPDKQRQPVCLFLGEPRGLGLMALGRGLEYGSEPQTLFWLYLIVTKLVLPCLNITGHHDVLVGIHALATGDSTSC